MSTPPPPEVLASLPATPVEDPILAWLAYVPAGLVIIALAAAFTAEWFLGGMQRRVMARLQHVEERLRRR